MLKITKETRKVEIDGSSYDLKVPTYKDSKKYTTDLSLCGDDSDKKVELLFNYLETLGLPKNVSYDLSVENVLNILSYLSGEKKS
jgi:hypothetical protein